MATATTATANPDTDALNELLRGEISAVETYDQALGKLSGKPAAEPLQRIRSEHVRVVGELKHQITQQGGEPRTSSGPWGVFANAVTGAAKLLGPETVLAALKKGEQHGIKEYEEVLSRDKVSESCKAMIRTKYLTKCHQHCTELDALIASNP